MWDTVIIELSIKKRTGKIGCKFGTTPDGRLVVISITKGSPAEKGGLQLDDVVTQVNDMTIHPYIRHEPIVQEITSHKNTRISVRRLKFDCGITDV